MRVVIDIQAAIAQRAGVGRYTKALVENIGAFAGHDELCLFYFDFQRKGTPFPVTGAEQKAVRWVPGRFVQKSWKTINWPPFDWFAGPADVYHFPNFIRPPLTRGKSVVTLHDTSFLRYPETTERKNLKYLTAQIRKTVDQSDAIITDSLFSAREIEALLNVDKKKVFPIWPGISPEIRRSSGSQVTDVRKKLQLDKPYLLTVGTLEPRKNTTFLVDVFERMTNFDGDLVIAGMRGWKYEPIFERIKESKCANRIKHLEYVEDDVLCSLYSGAELFVFPSLYEGFGFPPLEAMACGTPVVSSAGGSLPEVLGDAAEIIKDYDADAWTSAIDNLLGNSGRKGNLVKQGLARAAQYKWKDTAQKTWDVYKCVSA